MSCKLSRHQWCRLEENSLCCMLAAWPAAMSLYAQRWMCARGTTAAFGTSNCSKQQIARQISSCHVINLPLCDTPIVNTDIFTHSGLNFLLPLLLTNLLDIMGFYDCLFISFIKIYVLFFYLTTYFLGTFVRTVLQSALSLQSYIYICHIPIITTARIVIECKVYEAKLTLLMW